MSTVRTSIENEEEDKFFLMEFRDYMISGDHSIANKVN
jgi:hypothetical protein